MAYFHVQQWSVFPSIGEVVQGTGRNEAQAGLGWPIAVPQTFIPSQHYHPQHYPGQPIAYFSTSQYPYLQSSQRQSHDTMAGQQGGSIPPGDYPQPPARAQNPGDSEDAFSLDTLNTALRESSTSQSYNQAYSMTEPGQTYPLPPNYNPQPMPMVGRSQYQQTYPNQAQYVYHNTAQRPQTGSTQPRFNNQSMYQAQQAVFYPQYPQSMPLYQGLPRSPDGMMGRGYPPNIPQPLSPSWGQYQGEVAYPQASSPRSIPSTPRGPPRKPKQSGHALWVGNLPPGALVNDLKDHFSRDATNDIESVFLISKSNCAFVNYKTETACAAAMARFHDSRFSGVRLVCRLRRTSTNLPGPASGTSVVSGAAAAEDETAPDLEPANTQVEGTESQEAMERQVPTTEKVNDKYFIVKSLTVEDLELSARNGVWATQAHNEEVLNKAYESAENVYLIFSANKSGEYFGYARMTSPINEALAASLDWTPAIVQPVDNDPDLPRSIRTPATETAPKGRIIDDSARGTIFWEADSNTDDEENAPEDETDKPSAKPETKPSNTDSKEDTPTQLYGHPFRIQWLSTARVPFYRTRGLRNAWNSNREVKIARDGTELETGVGRRLVGMFGTMQAGTGDRFSPYSQENIPSSPRHFQQQQQQQQQQQRY